MVLPRAPNPDECEVEDEPQMLMFAHLVYNISTCRDSLAAL